MSCQPIRHAQVVFDLINGIPVHPLVVHAVVVLIPLTIVGTIVIAVVPRWRVTYGVPLVVIGAIATICVPIAIESGEALEERVGGPGKAHEEAGEAMIVYSLALLMLLAALVFLSWRNARTAASSNSSSPIVVNVVAGLAVAAALAASYGVYHVGDTGAKAVWAEEVSSQADSD